MIYHVGQLAVDRAGISEKVTYLGSSRTPTIEAIDTSEVAHVALLAWESGRVHLMQWRRHKGVFEYIAEKRK